MPKRIPVEAKRVSLNCLVLPETKAWLKSLAGSDGSIVDRAVYALRMQLAQGRAEAAIITATNEPETPEVIFTQAKAMIKTHVEREVVRQARPYKPPLLKPSEKRK